MVVLICEVKEGLLQHVMKYGCCNWDGKVFLRSI